MPIKHYTVEEATQELGCPTLAFLKIANRPEYKSGVIAVDDIIKIHRKTLEQIKRDRDMQISDGGGDLLHDKKVFSISPYDKIMSAISATLSFIGIYKFDTIFGNLHAFPKTVFALGLSIAIFIALMKFFHAIIDICVEYQTVKQLERLGCNVTQKRKALRYGVVKIILMSVGIVCFSTLTQFMGGSTNRAIIYDAEMLQEQAKNLFFQVKDSLIIHKNALNMTDSAMSSLGQLATSEVERSGSGYAMKGVSHNYIKSALSRLQDSRKNLDTLARECEAELNNLKNSIDSLERVRESGNVSEQIIRKSSQSIQGGFAQMNAQNKAFIEIAQRTLSTAEIMNFPEQNVVSLSLPVQQNYAQTKASVKQTLDTLSQNIHAMQLEPAVFQQPQVITGNPILMWKKLWLKLLPFSALTIATDFFLPLLSILYIGCLGYEVDKKRKSSSFSGFDDSNNNNLLSKDENRMKTIN